MASELNLNFNPIFGGPLDDLRADAEAQGIKTHVISGVRSADDQKQLYANYVAGKAGQPLPYPDRGAVSLAAKPGTSLHERGMAADVAADDPSQQKALWALAPKHGLVALGASDPDHFQIGKAPPVTQTASAAPAAASSAPAPAVDLRNSVYQTLIGRGLNPQQAMGSMYSLMGESGGGLDPGAFNPKDPGGAMGFAQWTGSRRAGLQDVAKSMGTTETDPTAQLAYFNKELDGPYKGVIDSIKSAPTAADATKIWTAQFENPKVNNWPARYAKGAQVASIGADGSPTWSTPAASSSAVASSAPAAATPAPSLGASLQKGDIGGALAALTSNQQDAQGNDKSGTSVTSQLAGMFKPKQQQQEIRAPEIPQVQDGSGAAMAQPSQELLSQIIAARAKPLTWSTTPYGSGSAGPVGTTLNSSGVA